MSNWPRLEAPPSVQEQEPRTPTSPFGDYVKPPNFTKGKIIE